MEPLLEKREELTIKIRSQRKKAEIAEKRLRFTLNCDRQNNKTQSIDILQESIVNKENSLDNKKVELKVLESVIHKGPKKSLKKETLNQLIWLLSQKLIVQEVIEFLVTYTASSDLNNEQLLILSQNIGIIVQLIDPSNSSLLENIVIVLGNLTIQIPNLSSIIMSNQYYSILFQSISTYPFNTSLIKNILWQIKNLFLINKTSKTNQIISQEFLDLLVKFVNKIMLIMTYSSQNSDQIDNMLNCLIIFEYILFDLKKITQNSQNMIKQVLLFFTAMLGQSKIVLNLADKIMSILQRICKINRQLIQHQINMIVTLVINCSLRQGLYEQLNNRILSLLEIYPHPDTILYLIISLDSFDQIKNSFFKSETKKKWSQFLMLVITKIGNIQQPKNQLQQTFSNHLPTILNKINLFLNDEDTNIIHNGIKTLYHIVSSVDNPLHLKDQLQQYGIIDSLYDLQKCYFKQIYDLTSDIFDLLEMSDEY